MAPDGRLENRMSGYISSLWQFPDRDAAANSYFRWYGTTPLALATKLLDITPFTEGPIVDLFCGTGTFGEAAAARGLPSILCDVNPLAILISRVRIHKFMDQSVDWEWINHCIDSSSEPTIDADEPFHSSYSRSWFNPTVLRQLRGYLKLVSNSRDQHTVDVGVLCGLSVVRRLAEVNTACTHHLVRKAKRPDSVHPVLRQRVTELRASWPSPALVSPEILPTLLNVSASQTKLESRIASAVVLHPPYLGVVNYFNIHRLALDLYLDVYGGSDCDAHAIKSSDVSGDMEERYDSSMMAVIHEAVRICSDDGSIILIQGDHRYKGRLRHPVDRQVISFEENSFFLHERFIWLIENNAGMHVRRKGHHIDHNYICVFRRSR